MKRNRSNKVSEQSKDSKPTSNNVILNIIIILSTLGFLTSLYLVQNHYAPPSAGSLCDLSESISCSLVNSSSYSQLFNVPVSVFGALWFLVLGLMAQKTKKNKYQLGPLVDWNIFGMLFVFYLIYAEIKLQAICPVCTIVHILTLATLILSVLLFFKLNKKDRKRTVKKYLTLIRPWIVLIVILNLIPLIIFNLPSSQAEDHTNLAQCITDSGVKMYGSFRCGVCAKTRAMFGDSFEQINEIECHPQGENSQTQYCLEKEIEGTPTWILEPNGIEEKRYTGFLSIEELKEFSGCDLE